MRYRQLEAALRRACDERGRFGAALRSIQTLAASLAVHDIPAIEEMRTLARRALQPGEWRSGFPHKRGVYRVKCGGEGASPNIGWRHFDGARWGNWSPSRAGAAARAKNPGRRARILRPVLWFDGSGA